MKKHRVVLTGKTWPEAFERLQEGCEIRQWKGKGKDALPREQLLEWLADADGLFNTSSMSIDDSLLAAAPHLKVVVQSSVGYDNVDVAALTARGIPFGNTPGVLVEATADLAFGIMLTAARQIHVGWDQVRSGAWATSGSKLMGVDLYGKQLGIVGMGDIGAAVAKRAQAFGMSVSYSNRTRRKDEQELNVKYAPFDQLLAESDFVLVLVPLSAASKGMFGREQFALMKSTAFFVNAARGALVDTDALYEALKTGEIAYAALDVTDPEPISGDHPLVQLPNILITPHIGSATIETRNRMANLSVDNLYAGLEGRRLPACVNPEVQDKE